MSIENYCKSNYNFIRFETIDSTNNYAKKMAKHGAAEGTVVIADSQTAGRGRLGRNFFSSLDGIYMSVILRPTFEADKIPLITVAAAVATAEAVDEICGVKTGIKWVNDIYLNDKKICGILTESSINSQNLSSEFAVLGIGINLSLAGVTLPNDIKDIAGYIFEDKTDDDFKKKLSIKILDNFFEYYKNLLQKDYINDYRNRSILIGKEVKCICGDTEYLATVCDINSDAGLVVRNFEGETKTLIVGEVSLKL